MTRTANYCYFIIVATLAPSVAGGGARRWATSGLLWRIARKGGLAQPFKPAVGSFVSAVPLAASFSLSSAESHATPSRANDEGAPLESCPDSENDTPLSLMSSRDLHPSDPNLWLFHVESTTSTMDEAKRIVENKFAGVEYFESAAKEPKSFLISAGYQTNGRGTTQRKWKSSQKGNALFTIGIPQSSWMNGLKSKNHGRMVPLTLLPLKVGSLVAFHIEKALEECTAKTGEIPSVTVKWPNDVLLRSPEGSHDKIAGILIESSQDWFLVGIGINVAYAPDIPSEGTDYGRRSTCLSQHCTAKGAIISEECGNDEEEHWMKASKKLAENVAYDMHSWLHLSSPTPLDLHSGEAILNQWKSYIDWDMELTLRDTPQRERVTMKAILEDGRVVVEEVETGSRRTLVADYFL